MPAPQKSYRATFTLPAEMAVTLNRLAKRMRMSQSALLVLLLEEPLETLDRLAAFLPDRLPDGTNPNVPAEQVRRLRGASGEAIRAAVRDALEVAESIDPKPELPL